MPDHRLPTTETDTFRMTMVDQVAKLHDKRTKDRIALICTIIGAIAVILTGVWFVFDLRFTPVEKRLDKIEMKMDVMDARIMDRETIKYIALEECRNYHTKPIRSND